MLRCILQMQLMHYGVGGQAASLSLFCRQISCLFICSVGRPPAIENQGFLGTDNFLLNIKILLRQYYFEGSKWPHDH